MAKKALSPAPEPVQLPLEHAEELRQLVLRVNGHRVRLEYEMDGDRIFLSDPVVPLALRDGSIEEVMIIKALVWVEERRAKLIPRHAKIKAYLRHNPDWKRLLLKGIEV
jgi:hypothetical protein